MLFCILYKITYLKFKKEKSVWGISDVRLHVKIELFDLKPTCQINFCFK